jgi:hypothetical protein
MNETPGRQVRWQELTKPSRPLLANPQARLAKMINNAPLLQAEPSVNLATVPHSGDSNDAGAVVYGVDHAVITGADAKVRPMASQRQETGRPRISGQAVDDLSDRLPHGRVELP